MPRKSRSKPRPRVDRPRPPLPEVGGLRQQETGLATASPSSPSPVLRRAGAAANRVAVRADYSHVKGELTRIAITSCVIIGVMLFIAIVPR